MCVNKYRFHRIMPSIINICLYRDVLQELMSYMCKSTCPIYNATQNKIHTRVNNNIAQYYSRSFGAVVLYRNMVSRRIFAPSMEEVAGHQRQMCNKDIHTVFSSRRIMRVLKGGGWSGHKCISHQRNEKDAVQSGEMKVWGT